MNSEKLVCGVDVSKDTLDLFFNDQAGKEHYLQVSNDQKGYALVIKRLGLERTFIMESSGPYYLCFAFTMKQKGGDVRVENPVVVKRFIQMNLERNKSDKKDSRWLYRYGVEREGSVWTIPSEESLKCSQVIGLMDLYTRQITQLSNQLHSLEQLPVIDKEVVKSLEKMRLKLETEVSKQETKLQSLLITWQGEQLSSLSTIPGLGKKRWHC